MIKRFWIFIEIFVAGFQIIKQLWELFIYIIRKAPGTRGGVKDESCFLKPWLIRGLEFYILWIMFFFFFLNCYRNTYSLKFWKQKWKYNTEQIDWLPEINFLLKFQEWLAAFYVPKLILSNSFSYYIVNWPSNHIHGRVISMKLPKSSCAPLHIYIIVSS